MKAATIAITIAATSTIATAGIVDMKFTGTGAGSAVQIQMGESNAFNVFAGQLEHQIINATGTDAFLNGTLSTFCADITEHVATEFAQFQTTDLQNIPLTASNPTPMNATQSAAIGALYAQNANTLLQGSVSNAFAAAFQLTIWEIVNDYTGNINSIDLTEGNLLIAGTNGDPINTDILTAIDTLKSSITTGINLGQTDSSFVLGLANEGYQDQLVTVPAPGALALLASGTLLITRRRRA